MSYLGRFLNWMMRGIIHVGKEIVMWALRQTISIIRFGFPYIVRAIGVALWLAWQLMALNLLSLFKPVTQVSGDVGRELSRQAILGGWFPSLHQLTLTRILTVVAFIGINVGFVMNLSLFVFMIVLLWEYGDMLLSLL